MAPWKRSIHSMMSGEQSCSDSPACVLHSAHSSSAAVKPLIRCSQEQATFAPEVRMPMARAAVLVWCAGVALDQHSAGVKGHGAQQHGKRAAPVWITLKQLRKIALVANVRKTIINILWLALTVARAGSSLVVGYITVGRP